MICVLQVLVSHQSEVCIQVGLEEGFLLGEAVV